jgi:hypothetical protein
MLCRPAFAGVIFSQLMSSSRLRAGDRMLRQLTCRSSINAKSEFIMACIGHGVKEARSLASVINSALAVDGTQRQPTRRPNGRIARSSWRSGARLMVRARFKRKRRSALQILKEPKFMRFSLKAVILSVQLLMCLALVGFGYAPSDRCLHLSATFGPGFHSSDISKEEDRVAKEYGFYVWRRNNATGVADTQAVKYSYLDLAFDFNAVLFPFEQLGFGIIYHYGNINQSTKVKNSTISESLVDLHRIGVILTYWPDWVRYSKIGLSFSVPLGYATGGLHRFAVMTKVTSTNPSSNYSFAQLNKRIQCNGIFSGARIDFNFLTGNNFSLVASATYDIALISIPHNESSPYPTTSLNQELGIRFGFSFLSDKR